MTGLPWAFWASLAVAACLAVVMLPDFVYTVYRHLKGG